MKELKDIKINVTNKKALNWQFLSQLEIIFF